MNLQRFELESFRRDIQIGKTHRKGKDLNALLIFWQTLPTWVAPALTVYTALAYSVTFVVLLLVFIGFFRSGSINLETKITPVTPTLVTGVVLVLMWLTLSWLIFPFAINLLMSENKRRAVLLRLH